MYDLGSLKACIIQAVLSWDQRPIYTAWFSNSWPDVWSTCSRRRAVFAMAQQSAPRPIVSFNVQALVARILIWEAGADKNANGQPPQGTSEMKQWELALLNPCRKARHRCDHEWVPPIRCALCALDFNFFKIDCVCLILNSQRLVLIFPRLIACAWCWFLWGWSVRLFLCFWTGCARLILTFQDWFCALAFNF